MKYPKEIIDKLNAVTAKRPRTVIQHILKHGFVTTEELENLYGYKHAPRAARDVREQGIPLEMFRVKSSDGRSIGAYRRSPQGIFSMNGITPHIVQYIKY